MQNAKDSFYVALRSRLAALNPDRTVLVRGTVRPGIVVEEAEALFGQALSNAFMIRWLGLGADTDIASMMLAQECEISYSTTGTQAFGGLDRGRMLSTMDRELLQILQPFSTPKMDYSIEPPAPKQTQVFWDEPMFAPITVQRDRIGRSVRVMVYSYQEQGE